MSGAPVTNPPAAVLEAEQVRSAPPTLLRKTVWSAAASTVNSLGVAICSIAVARILGPAGTGRVAYALWLISTVVAVVSLGLPQCMTRYLPELHGAGFKQRADGLARWLVWRGLATSLLGVAVVVPIWLLTQTESRDAGQVLLIGVVLLAQSANGLALGFLAGFQDFRRTTNLNLFSGLVQIAGVGIGAAAWGARGALAGYALAGVVPVVLLLRVVRAGPADSPDPALKRRMARYSLDTWAAVAISMFVWSRMEVFFLDRFWDKQAVAMFTTGLTLSLLATQVPMLLAGALVPHFAQQVGAGDLDSLHKTYAGTTRLIAFVAFPLCLGTAAITPSLLPLLFGQAFAPAAPSAMVLVAFAAVGVTAGVQSSLVYALERSRFIAVVGAVGACVACVVYYLAIGRWSVWGAAWARSLLQVAMVGIGVLYVKTALQAPVPFAALFRIAAAAALSGLGGFAVVRAYPGVGALLPAGTVVAALYLGLTRYLNPLQADDWRRLGHALQRSPRWLEVPARRVLGWLSPTA